MIIKNQLILNTEVTKNSHKYSLDVLESIKEQINSKPKSANIGTIGYTDQLVDVLIDAAFMYTNAIIRDGGLYVDIEILPTPQGKVLENGFNSHTVFRPKGMSSILDSIDHIGIVSDSYELLGIAAIDKKDDAVVY